MRMLLLKLCLLLLSLLNSRSAVVGFKRIKRNVPMLRLLQLRSAWKLYPLRTIVKLKYLVLIELLL